MIYTQQLVVVWHSIIVVLVFAGLYVNVRKYCAALEF